MKPLLLLNPQLNLLVALLAERRSILYEAIGMHVSVSSCVIDKLHPTIAANHQKNRHSNKFYLTPTIFYKVHVIAFMTDFKEQGNRLFSERRYTEAVEAYSSAIVSVLYHRQYTIYDFTLHQYNRY